MYIFMLLLSADNHARHSWGGQSNYHHRPHHRDMSNFHQNQNQINNTATNDEDVLLSFKNWVMKQDDNINEDDACKNYKVCTCSEFRLIGNWSSRKHPQEMA